MLRAITRVGNLLLTSSCLNLNPCEVVDTYHLKLEVRVVYAFNLCAFARPTWTYLASLMLLSLQFLPYRVAWNWGLGHIQNRQFNTVGINIINWALRCGDVQRHRRCFKAKSPRFPDDQRWLIFNRINAFTCQCHLGRTRFLNSIQAKFDGDDDSGAKWFDSATVSSAQTLNPNPRRFNPF